jgi:hypothetical protein
MKEKREFRCAHGFYRSVVRCVKCETAERPVVAPPAAAPSAPLAESTGASIEYKCGHRYESKQTRRVYRCGACGERGHSRTTCARLRGMAKNAEPGRPELKFRPVPVEFSEPAPKQEKRSA